MDKLSILYELFVNTGLSKDFWASLILVFFLHYRLYFEADFVDFLMQDVDIFGEFTFFIRRKEKRSRLYLPFLGMPRPFYSALKFS